MLGSVKHKAGWIWYASGKHPAAKDFLAIGPRDPLLQAFADWVSGGFRQWSTQNNPKTAQNSWRFWTRSTRRQHIICGVSRDSCDSIGRSFPLVIVGSGHLRDWQAHWELLPLVLDKTWLQMEYLSTKRLLDFNHLEDEVRMLPLPLDQWSELSLDGRQAADPNAGANDSAAEETPLQHMISGRSDPLVGIMPLINISQNDPPRQLSLLHAMLKKRSHKAPNAVFMGGIPEKSCLVLFKRPLRPDDFITLWSSCSQISSSQSIA
jgi:type VI secretion system ImpM family protein